MSSAKGDNVIRVDFRQGVVLGEGEEVEAPEAVEEEPFEAVVEDQISGVVLGADSPAYLE